MAEGLRRVRAARRTLMLCSLLVTIVALTGCAESGSAKPASSTVPVPAGSAAKGVTYWEGDGGPLKLDACLPKKAGAPAPAVILIHGGGFVEGSRSGMSQLCDQLAARGFAAFAIDYRFAPTFTYPSQVNDVAATVSWLRQPENVAAYNIDPARIGLVGSSAGAILAQQAGTRGEGPLNAGDRVAAVVSLSGVSLMTAEGLALGTPKKEGIAMILAYLGCKSAEVKVCPQSVEASALTHVDPSDPPMLLFNSDNELVPEEQSKTMHDALTAAGITSELTIVPGTQHGVQLLNQQNRDQLFKFLETSLA